MGGPAAVSVWFKYFVYNIGEETEGERYLL